MVPHMRRNPSLRLCNLSVTAALLSISLAAGAGPLPDKLKVVAPGVPDSISITLENVTYTTSPANAGAPVAGKGTIKVSVAGNVLPASFEVPFTNVVANDDGQIVGGGFALTQELPITNLLGTGCDLILAKASQLVVTATPAPITCKITGAITARLPYRSDAGEQAVLNLPNNEFALNVNGDFSLQLRNATLTGPTAESGITLAGFTFKASSADFGFKKPGTGKKFDLTCLLRDVFIKTPIPNLLTQDDAPLAIKATEVGMNERGEPTFTNAKLAMYDYPPVRIASTQNVRGIPTGVTNKTIHLTKPLDFVIEVKSADVSVKDGAFTAFNLSCDIALPPQLKDANGDRVQIKNVTVNVQDGVLISQIAPLALKWNTFTLNTGGFVIDLSPSKGSPEERDPRGVQLPNDWQGVYIKSASLGLPPTLGSARCGVENFYVDGYGISGAVDVSKLQAANVTLMGFKARLLSGGLTFSRNSVVGGGIAAEVQVPAWTGSIALNAKVSTSGLVTVEVATSRPLTASRFGMKVVLNGGSIRIPTQGGAPQLFITGAFGFDGSNPALKLLGNAMVEFKDLGIDSAGNIKLPNDTWLTLPHPATVNLGVAQISCSQVGFGKEGTRNWIGLSGDVKLTIDMPITGSIGFQGLKIMEGPELRIGGITLDCKVMEICHVKGGVSFQDQDFGGSAGRQSVFKGNVALQIMGGIGGQAECMITKGGWYVKGGFAQTVPPGLIPLGNSGLSIFGFNGGFGRNVRLANTQKDPNLRPIYDMTVDPNLRNLMFQAGVTLGTVDGFTVWGNGTLTVITSPFLLNVNGKFYFLEPVSITPTGHRIASADITYDSAARSFRASFGADFAFPTRDLNLMHLTGSMDMLMSPSEKFLRIGWPIDKDPIGVRIFGVVDVRGGAELQIEPEQRVQAGILYRSSFGPLSGQLDGTLDVRFRPTIRGTGSIHAKGSADFIVFSASAEGWLTAALQQSPFQLDIDGRVQGCIGSVFGDVCKSIGIGVRVSKGGVQIK